MKPSWKTIKKLFAVSHNQCAFQNCESPVVEESDSITGVVCHIKARSIGGPRYDAQQTEEERHSFANLILLCSRHGKIIDSEPERYTVDKLREMKRQHEQRGPVELSQSDARKAELLFRHYDALSITAGGHVMLNSPGSVQASNVVIKSPKKAIKIASPAGSLGCDLSRRNYVKHLIDRYQEFAKQQPGRNFRSPVVYAAIKRQFGANWDSISLQLFDDLVLFLQQRVDRTMLGSMNRSKGTPNYSTFAEYRKKYEHHGVPKS
jgi:hypothetical protein